MTCKYCKNSTLSHCSSCLTQNHISTIIIKNTLSETLKRFDEYIEKAPLRDFKETNDFADYIKQFITSEIKLAQSELLQEMQEIAENLPYNEQGIGCGLEDVGITNRYEAARYGWDESLRQVIEMIKNNRKL